MRGVAGVKISRPQKHREDTTLREAPTQRQMRGNAPAGPAGFQLILILDIML